MERCKQVVVLREDIEMTEGKRIAQACHASLGAVENASEDVIENWKDSGSPKIVLKSDNLDELQRKARSSNIANFLVKDAGKTELEPGTVTALGLGPDKESKLDSITGELSLVN